MSDFAAAGGASGAPGGGHPARLSPPAVDAVLSDFRAWLSDWPGPVAGDAPPAPAVDLFTLVGQFTALRHEVNLQTKAARAAVEQNAEVLRHLATPPDEAEDEEPEDAPDEDEPEAADEDDGDTAAADEIIRPFVKAVIDIGDALALSLRQMEKLRDAAETLVAHAPADSPPTAPAARPGFFARLFGAPPAPQPPAPPAGADPAAGKLRQFASAAADGYAMSLRRVERLLPTFGVEPIPAVGEAFDPELMEVVEVVAAGQAPGTVVEAVRPGYYWRGRLLRYAQVKVAR